MRGFLRLWTHHMLEQLIERVFATRNAAHLAHWKATGPGSYARHSALGDFYGSAIDTLDRLVEASQGFFGIIGDVSDAPSQQFGDILGRLTVDLAWITANRDGICQGVPALENILDDLTDLYATTIYKLRFLA